MEQLTMAKMPSPPQQPNKQHRSTQDITIETDMKHDRHLSLSQPRYSTSEIFQQFPNINYRFCHKINVSIPWKDDQTIPNLDTHHKAIIYFLTMVKNYDSHFQILPWNILYEKECNPISENVNIPETHHELLSYLYNVHVTLSRVRSSMVVTSLYNLGELFKYQTRGDAQQINLLKNFNTINSG
jgi:hypothetical protein